MFDMTEEDVDIFESPSQTHIEWNIKKFSTIALDIGHYKESPSFPLGKADWWLFSYSHSETVQKCDPIEDIVKISGPNGENVGNADHSGEIVKSFANNDGTSEIVDNWISLYLVKCSSDKKHRVAYKMGIKKTDGSELELFEEKCVFDFEKDKHGQRNFIRISELLNSSEFLTPDDTLVVFCAARILDITSSTAQTSSSEGISALTKDFRDMYINRLFTDVILNVKSREFHVHKSVLAARSTIFSSMLENEMVEKSGGIVDISDCDPGTFERFLLFLYTGKLESMSCTEAISLYKTAAKYNLNDLKEECMYFMRRQLSVDTFCDVAQLAVKQSEYHLQDVITDYFISNAKSILKTTQWITFLRENTVIGNDLLLEVLSESNSSKN